MDLDAIPPDQHSFPAGVSEVVYDTKAEIDAFVHGLDYADDMDVEHNLPFLRADRKWVVRVRVGNFGDE